MGNISGPINAGRTGVVAKIVDKQEPTADEIAKNFDQTRDQILDERRNEAFSVFMSSVMERLQEKQAHPINAKAQQGRRFRALIQRFQPSATSRSTQEARSRSLADAGLLTFERLIPREPA